MAYPAKTFISRNEKHIEVIQRNSKKYVQRFFDATKSSMLFSEKVILVEGIAEQLLLLIFANYMEKSLEENHVAVINVGGRYFQHFLYMFNSKNKFAISKIHGFLYSNVVKPYCSFLHTKYNVCVSKVKGHEDPYVNPKIVSEWLKNDIFNDLKHPNSRNQLLRIPIQKKH